MLLGISGTEVKRLRRCCRRPSSTGCSWHNGSLRPGARTAPVSPMGGRPAAAEVHARDWGAGRGAVRVRPVGEGLLADQRALAHRSRCGWCGTWPRCRAGCRRTRTAAGYLPGNWSARPAPANSGPGGGAGPGAHDGRVDVRRRALETQRVAAPYGPGAAWVSSYLRCPARASGICPPLSASSASATLAASSKPSTCTSAFAFRRSRLPTDFSVFDARSHANLPILNRFE